MRTAGRRVLDGWLLAAGAALTVLAAWLVSPGTVSDAERAVFGAVNGWPDVLRGPFWVVQLLGVLGTPLAVAAGALAARRPRPALALVLLIPLKLLVEKGVLKALVERQRPGTTIPGAILRDVPAVGPSFPSGHAIIAFGIAVLLVPYLRRRWQVLVVLLAVLNSLARVYLGAHAPLDVLGGAAAGVAVAAALNLVVGVASPSRSRGGRS